MQAGIAQDDGEQRNENETQLGTLAGGKVDSMMTTNARSTANCGWEFEKKR